MILHEMFLPLEPTPFRGMTSRTALLVSFLVSQHGVSHVLVMGFCPKKGIERACVWMSRPGQESAIAANTNDQISQQQQRNPCDAV